MTRMRAELGPPTHELHGVHPDRLMITLLGSRALGATNLTKYHAIILAGLRLSLPFDASSIGRLQDRLLFQDF